jgi:hypothetical protein
MSNTSPFLDDYRRVRPIQRQLGTLASKKIGKPAIESEAKMIGLWRQGSLVLEAEEELNTLFDHLVHDGNGGPSTPPSPSPGSASGGWWNAALGWGGSSKTSGTNNPGWSWTRS